MVMPMLPNAGGVWPFASGASVRTTGSPLRKLCANGNRIIRRVASTPWSAFGMPPASLAPGVNRLPSWRVSLLSPTTMTLYSDGLPNALSRRPGTTPPRPWVAYMTVSPVVRLCLSKWIVSLRSFTSVDGVNVSCRIPPVCSE